MLPHILRYLRAEKQAAVWLLLIGAVAVLAALVLWRRRGALRGMAIPLAAVAIMQLAAGAVVFLRTDAQIDSITELYYSDPARFQTLETSRLEAVSFRLRVLLAIEATALVAGLIMLARFRARPFWRSAGAGLVLQSIILIVFDGMASMRAATYLEALSRMR